MGVELSYWVKNPTYCYVKKKLHFRSKDFRVIFPKQEIDNLHTLKKKHIPEAKSSDLVKNPFSQKL